MPEKSLILPLSGNVLSGLTNKYTLCEYDLSQYDGSGLLKDMKGGENLTKYCNDLSQTTWGKTNCTIASTAVVLPDGTKGIVNTLAEDSQNGQHYITFRGDIVAGKTYTISFFAKAAGRTGVLLECPQRVSGHVFFDLAAGTIFGNGGGVRAKSITSVGNGWYRCVIVNSADDGGSSVIMGTISPYVAGAYQYQGDGRDSLYIWGAQLEQNNGYSLAANPLFFTGANASIRHDLTATAAPVIEVSPFVSPSGRPLKCIHTNGNQYFSKSHDNAFDFGLGDFALMVVGKKDNSSSNPSILQHQNGGQNGWALQWRTDNTILFALVDPSPAYAYSEAIAYQDSWFVIHAVNRSGVAQIYLNGRSSGIPVTSLGKGGAGSADFILNHVVPGSTLYARIDSGRRMTDAEIIAEAGQAMGLYGIRPGKTPVSYTFGRSAPYQTYVNTPDGMLKVVPANAPRLGSSAKIKNWFARSQEIDHAAWSKVNQTITANNTTAPDGTSTADLVTESTDGSNQPHYFAQQVTHPRGKSFTISAHVKFKTSGRSWVNLYNYEGGQSACFNIQTGVVGWVGALAKSGVVDAGNGWYRIWMTSNTSASQSTIWWDLCSRTANGSGNDIESYTGDGRGCFWVWGLQVEEGPLTDYVPTLADRKNSAICAPQTASKNIIRWSQDFDRTTPNNSPGLWWPRGTDSLTKNAAVGPDGTQSMFGYIACTNNDAHIWQQTDRTLVPYQAVLSVYVKAGAKNYAIVSSSSVGSCYAIFDLVGGTVSYQAPGVTVAGIDSIGSGIYRCWISFAQPAGVTGNRFGPAYSASVSDYAGDGVTVEAYFWGCQVEIGYKPSSYVKTTNSLFQLCDSFTDGNAFLAEDTRTNLFTYSQQFDQSTWTKFLGWIVSNGEIAPDGLQTADGYGPDATSGTHGMYQALTPANTPHVFSVFAKTRGLYPWMKLVNSGTVNQHAYFNLATGQVSTVGAGVTAYGMIPYANGIWRCWIMFTPTAVSSNFYVICAFGDANDVFTGANYYAEQWYWGAQLEAGSNLTSYIPTGATTATRDKDQLYMLPYKLNKMLQNYVGAAPMFSCSFEKDTSANMYSTGNLLRYSQNFNDGAWSKMYLSVGANADGLAPDGSQNPDILHESSNAGTVHVISQVSLSLSVGASYTASVYLKDLGKASRTWVRVGCYDSTNAIHQVNSYFNFRDGFTGTVSGSATVKSSKIEKLDGGWYRCSITWTQVTGNSTAGQIDIYLASTEGTLVYDGLDQDVVAAWGAKLELDEAASRTGPTQYVRTDGTATSQYAMTKNGNPKSRYTENEGFFHEFDGINDYWTIANGAGGANFNFAGSFSLQGSFTPLSVTGGVRNILSKWSTGGVIVRQNNADLEFYTGDGTNTSISVASCLAIGKPIRFLATFEDCGGATNNKMRLYVDGFTAASSDVGRKPLSNTSDVGFGAAWNGSEKFIGRIHEFTAYNGYVASQAEHDNGYAAWKIEGLLPPTISNTTRKKKLRVTFDAKCLFDSTTDIGPATALVIDIRGSAGSAAVDRNRVWMGIANEGRAVVNFYDNGTVSHYGSQANGQSGYSVWRTYSVLLDLANLANLVFTIDGSSSGITYGGNAGTALLDLRDTLIIVGGGPNTAPSMNSLVRNVAFSAEE